MIKTKIVATLGPASSQPEQLEALIASGVDVFRMNFSHGDLEKHAEVLRNLNQIRAKHHRTTAVMGDLCGPKIRTSKIEPEGQELHPGDEVTIHAGLETGSAVCFGTNYSNFFRDVEVGQRVLIDDGQISMEITQQFKDKVICRVDIGGFLFSHKGINLPDTHISVPSITERDWQCVDWAIEHQLDFLALSFVRSDSDIQQLAKYIHKADSTIKVIAKIEKPEALEHLENIVHASDAVLVARGDMGVEMDLAQVPLYQKRITQLCRRLGKPVIVATQMLQSMIENPTPTRAEVSDIANAIMDYTDAVMLSGETAIGKYPLHAVRTITKIAKVTESFMDQIDLPRPKIETNHELAVTAAIARTVAQMIDEIGAKLVAVWSQTGSTAQLLSKARIDVPIIAMSSDEFACRQMSLHYGVIPVCIPVPGDIREFSDLADKLSLENQLAQPGDPVVLIAGRPLGAPGTTNAIMVHTLVTPPK
ncbi:MAG: Pyruvate kinase I [Planctomycetes bacterium ADurb.Bin412]|nr:MAG: Pyruvate kinase I [Planctomycetes bacterium ADurb.Bin412]